MKRAKKAIPKIKKEIIHKEFYEIQCPFCKTFFRGGFNRQSLRISCSRCNNPITIDWDNGIKVECFVVKSLPDLELEFCSNCFQMTNHLNNKCQKCQS